MSATSRTARLWLVLAGSVTAGALLTGCDPGTAASIDSAASTTPSAVAAPTTTPAPVIDSRASGTTTADADTVATTVGTDATRARVSRVIDGDTFETTGGDRVRVLGIDSCEAGTTRGAAATGAASLVLHGTTVTLSREPGADRDSYGRMLRYVTTTDGRDFGRYMVALDHTAVYEGGNDANTSYVRSLRAADPNGRICGSEAARTTTSKPTSKPTSEPAPDQPPKPRPAPRTTEAPAVQPAESGGSAYYKNCTAARAAGAAPLLRGEPGYRGPLDRDNDGVACE